MRKKKRHNGNNNEEYDYNIRNWTTRIKSGNFEQKLYYNTFPSYYVANPGYYNGNISHNVWTYGNKTRGYSYFYDNHNRYTGSYAYTDNQLMADYNLTEYLTYDKMGNIGSLSRTDDGRFYNIDHLVFSYNGNQITKITDSYGSMNVNNLKEYQDKANLSVEFLYDANGNMITDLDREIVTIRYNLLNLPDTVQFKGGFILGAEIKVNMEKVEEALKKLIYE